MWVLIVFACFFISCINNNNQKAGKKVTKPPLFYTKIILRILILKIALFGAVKHKWLPARLAGMQAKF